MRKLRLQLITILVLTALLPALPAAFTVRELFRLSLDPLLEESVLEGAQAGLAATREMLEEEKQRFLLALGGVTADDSAPAGGGIAADAPIDTLTAARLAALDPREQSALETWQRAAQPVDPAAAGVQVLLPPERLPLAGEERLIAYIRGAGGMPVWVSRPIPRELAARAGRLSDSVRLVQTLRRERGKVIRSLVATFLVVYGVILALLLLVGLLLASRLTRPLAALGAGIDRVAAGDLNTQVVTTAGGEIGQLLLNFNQMVHRLRSQQTDLVRLERLAAWRQMARRLAHEIKNPLTPIQLAAQEIRDRAPDTAPDYQRLVNEGTTIIEEEVQGLRALVTEFSQFARLPEPQISRVDVGELLAEVAGLYGPTRIHARWEPAGAVPAATSGAAGELWCDRQQIHRVLINLINNALAAQEDSGAGEPVEIVATPAGDAGEALKIIVADRGPGVPETERERIFEPDVTTRPDGMGLGLAIVHSTIQSHGGTIAVTDRSGGGAIFVIQLPVGAPEDEGSST